MAGGVCCRTNVHTVSQTAPSPGISLIHILPHEAEISSVSTTDSSSGPSNYSRNVQEASGPLKDVHPTRLMENFLEIASDNTKKDIETCGVLGAILVMVPESIGIVMAPTDPSRAYGIFRLSDGGKNILKDCPEKGFHPHKEPVDGSPLYGDCSNVYINSCLRLEIFDLR